MIKKPVRKKTNNSPLEESECRAFSEYLFWLQKQGKIIKFAHIANETAQLANKLTSLQRMRFFQRLNKLGNQKGLPDYIIVVRDVYNSHVLLFIEMKRSKGGKQDANQKSWEKALNQAGEYYFVCKGFDEAQSLIDKTIKGL